MQYAWLKALYLSHHLIITSGTMRSPRHRTPPLATTTGRHAPHA